MMQSLIAVWELESTIEVEKCDVKFFNSILER